MFLVTLYLPVIVVLAAFTWLILSGSRQAFVLTIALVCVSLAVWLPMEWFLRNGLGPDSIESDGVLAWRRFLEGAAVPFVFFGVIVAASIGRYCLGRRRSVQ
jgi:hypothetical protein